MKHAALLLSFLIFCGTAQAQAALDRSASVAFLGVTYLDTSLQGELDGSTPEELARIDLLERTVRDRLRAEGFTLLDLAPVADDLAQTVNPADCAGCELRMGETLGAKYVLVGEVQKVSNLILSMNLVLRDVASGSMVRGQSVDIRSNTDESWLRGIRYILNNSIFKT